MYNRDFGGIKSDGQLYNLEREYNRHNHPKDYVAPHKIELRQRIRRQRRSNTNTADVHHANE